MNNSDNDSNLNVIEAIIDKAITNEKVVTSEHSNNKHLTVLSTPKVATPELNLGITKSTIFEGVEMGVLSDGTPFLTQNSLANMCGVSIKSIQNITNNWNDNTPSVIKLKDILSSHKVNSSINPYIAVKHQGNTLYAYNDVICVAFMEYFAFEANNCTDKAKNSFRKLAGKGLRDLVYEVLEYTPSDNVPPVWRHYHDRLSLIHDSCPEGYFGIFKEISDLVLHLGQNGLPIDEKFVPDISIGRAWSKYWEEENLAAQFGERLDYPHNYPASFPQSKSNPQHPFCYPEEALHIFKKWIREQYIGKGKMKKYLETKVKDNTFSLEFVQSAMQAFNNKKAKND